MRKLTELALDESAEMRWRESNQGEADSIGAGPAAQTDLQDALFESPYITAFTQIQIADVSRISSIGARFDAALGRVRMILKSAAGI